MDPASTEIYPLSLHDALPICRQTTRDATMTATSSTPTAIAAGRLRPARPGGCSVTGSSEGMSAAVAVGASSGRSEEHTSELQSRQYLVCRLLLEKKTPTSSSSALRHRGETTWPRDPRLAERPDLLASARVAVGARPLGVT